VEEHIFYQIILKIVLAISSNTQIVCLNLDVHHHGSVHLIN